jgi:hypothetical protein
MFKTFYGGFAGPEGNLKTEVLDVNRIDIPDPRNANETLVNALIEALETMQKRVVGRACPAAS